MEAVLVPQPLTLFIGLGFAGRQVRVIGAVPCRAKPCRADHTNNKLQLSREWRVQSDFIDIHAVHAYCAVLPSKP